MSSDDDIGCDQALTGLPEPEGISSIRHPILLLLTASLLSTVTSPFFGNWEPFENILHREGVYASLCSDGTECEARRAAFELLDASAVATSYVFASLGGFAYDRFGSKPTAIFGFTMQTLGVILLAECDPLSSEYNVPLMLVGGGAIFSFYGFVHTAELFPGNSALVLGLLGGFRSLGLGIPLIMDWANDWGMPAQLVFLIYAALLVCLLTLYFKLIPHKPVATLVTNVIQIARNGLVQPLLPPQEEPQWEVFVNSTTTRKFVSFLTYYVIMVLITEWFSDTASRQNPDIGRSFALWRPWAFLAGPLIGLLIGKLGPFIVMHMISLVAIFLCAFRALPASYRGSAFPPIIFFMVTNAFTDTQWYSLVGIMFPQRYLGRLTGMALVTAGLFLTVLVPMSDFSELQSSYTQANLLLLALAISSIGLTLFLRRIYSHCDKEEEVCPYLTHSSSRAYSNRGASFAVTIS